MTYDQLRNILSIMVRGESVFLEHPINTIEVEFDNDGVFYVYISTPDGAHTTSSSKSVKEITQSLLHFYQ